MTSRRSLFVATLAALTAVPASAQDQYLEQIENQIEAAHEMMDEDGYYPILRLFSGSMDAGETEKLTLRIEGGAAIQVVGVCDNDCSDLDLTIYDPSGNEVAEDVLLDDVPMLDFAARTSGAYTLEVSMLGCSAEPCYWGVQAYGADDARAGGAPGTDDKIPGTSTNYEGELGSGDERLGGGEYFDSYTAEVVAGDLLTIDLRSSTFDPYLIVRSPTGESHENDDFEASMSHSRLEIEAAESGTWEIVATSYAEDMRGDYTVDVTVEGSSGGSRATTVGGLRRESGSLTLGDETLTSGEYVDDYFFTGSSGEQVIVDLRSADFDPYLIVLAPDDEQEDNDDYEGDMTRSLVRFTLPTSGEYRVRVTSYQADETGSYDLSIEQGVAGSAARSAVSEEGTLTSGDESLRTGEYVDEFTFEASPGEHVTVDLRSSDFDTYVMLLGPGDFRQENDDADDGVGHSVIEADLSDAGTYRVLVTSYAPEETGSYELSIDRGEVEASTGQRDVQRLQLGRSASGTLESGDGELETGEFRDLWVFDAEAGQSITAEVSSADFDTYVRILSPEGEVIDENDDFDGSTDLSRVSVTLRESGRYRLIATTYSAGETGSYDVSVRSLAAATVDRDTSARATGGAGTVYGVFVGISDYGGRAGDLAYTAQDAIRAAEAMVEGAGMQSGNAIVLTDAQATVANMRRAFEDMGRRVGPDDTFVYFYSGHGSRVPRPGPERSDPDALDETIELYDDAVTDNEMSDLFDLIEARVAFIILDSCFSGGFSKDVISVPGRMGFFSSEEDVTSQVASKFRAGGYLAQFLFDAVGERLADADSDGAINAIELSQYIHERYRSDVKSGGTNDYVRTGGPQSGFQHFVADRGSIGPDEIIFR